MGRADQPDTPPILATQQFALPGYLSAIGTAVRKGRDFTAEDISAQRGAAIIDEGLAKRLWPEGAIGKRLAVYRTGWRDDFEVVGVTAVCARHEGARRQRSALHDSVWPLPQRDVAGNQDP